MAPEEHLLRSCLERLVKPKKDGRTQSEAFATGLSFSKHEWPQVANIPLHDYTCSLNFRGQLIEGRGTDPNENQAIIKALAEVLERCCFRAHEKCSTTSGWAIHNNFEDAASNARAELFERHIVLTSHLTQTPWIDITAEAQNSSSLIVQLKAHFENFGIILSLHRSPLDSQAHLALIRAVNSAKRSCPNFGIYMGASYGEAATAIPKAAIEVARAAAHLLALWNSTKRKDTSSIETRSTLPIIDLLNFSSAGVWSPECHDQLALNQDYVSQYSYIWSKPSPVASSNKNHISSDVSYETLALPEEFSGLPFVCVRASSSTLQNYYVGPTDEKCINRKALALMGFDPQLPIHTFPHPLG